MVNFFIHFLVNNWLTLALSVGLIIVAFRHQNMNRKTAIYFVLAASCCLLCAFFSGLDIYYAKSSFATLNPLRVVGSLFAYALKPLPSIFVLYFLLKLEGKNERLIMGLVAIPAIINFVICMLSFPLGKYLVCTFSEDNHWHPGAISLFPSLVGYLYLAAILAVTIYRATRRDFEEFFVVLFMIIVVGVACLLEGELGSGNELIYESSLINGSTSIGLVFIYLHLYISSRNKIDDLTGLHNRGSYYYEIAKYKNKVTAIISIDMNNLKEINDTYGHSRGDLALSTIGSIIKKASKTNSAYRLGGDEFLIVCFKTKEDEVVEIISLIKNEVQQAGYSVAVGYCMAGEGNFISVDNALKLADDRMYKDKQEMKANLRNNYPNGVAINSDE